MLHRDQKPSIVTADTHLSLAGLGWKKAQIKVRGAGRRLLLGQGRGSLVRGAGCVDRADVQV